MLIEGTPLEYREEDEIAMRASLRSVYESMERWGQRVYGNCTQAQANKGLDSEGRKMASAYMQHYGALWNSKLFNTKQRLAKQLLGFDLVVPNHLLENARTAKDRKRLQEERAKWKVEAEKELNVKMQECLKHSDYETADERHRKEEEEILEERRKAKEGRLRAANVLKNSSVDKAVSKVMRPDLEIEIDEVYKV